MLIQIPKTKHEQLVAELFGFVRKRSRKMQWCVRSRAISRHVFRDKATFQSRIVVIASRGHYLWTKDVVRCGIKFLTISCLFAPEDRKAARISVIENLHHLGFFIRDAEISFINNEGSF